MQEDAGTPHPTRRSAAFSSTPRHPSRLPLPRETHTMPRRFSDPWLEALQVMRTSEWPELRGVPMLPWITPPVPKAVRNCFESAGRRQRYRAGQHLFVSPFITDFILITSGLSGRYLAPNAAQAEGAGILAFSTPGRFACGNLNFFTRRPTIGQYAAVSDMEGLALSHAQMDEVLNEEPRLMRSLFAHLETTNLSDRLAFAVMTLLPAVSRYKCLLLAWAAYYGTFEGDMIVMPMPGRNAHVERVIGTSSVTMDKIRAELHDTAQLERSGDFVRFRPEILQDVHDWMRRTDNANSVYARHRNVIDFLADMHSDGYGPRPD